MRLRLSPGSATVETGLASGSRKAIATTGGAGSTIPTRHPLALRPRRLLLNLAPRRREGSEQTLMKQFLLAARRRPMAVKVLRFVFNGKSAQNYCERFRYLSKVAIAGL